MATLFNNPTPDDDDTELVGSRIGRINPDNFSSDASPRPSGASVEDEDDGLFDEPVDEDRKPNQ